jgi:16S rRNA processing protein RimM
VLSKLIFDDLKAVSRNCGVKRKAEERRERRGRSVKPSYVIPQCGVTPRAPGKAIARGTRYLPKGFSEVASKQVSSSGAGLNGQLRLTTTWTNVKEKDKHKPQSDTKEFMHMADVLIGEVIKPHGVQGELKVHPITDNPQRFKKLKEVMLTKEQVQRRFNVLNAKVLPDGVYLTLEGVSSRDEAEKLRGWSIKVDRGEVPPLKEGWYYFELEGMQVYEGDSLLGTLTQVVQTGANDVYLVKGPKGEICVPALKSVVKNVDVPGKRMDVELPLGLLEGDE